MVVRVVWVVWVVVVVLSVGHAPQHTARTLTLVAKTIQCLSNLVQFGEKEPYMKDMNSLILDNLDEMKGFIDNVVVCVLIGA
jgi:hypothetical protein